MALTRVRLVYLSDDGTTDGTKDWAVNGATPQEFFVTIRPGFDHFMVKRLILHMEDTGSFTSITFAAITGLTQGCELEMSSGGQVIDFCDGEPIKNNSDWGRLSFNNVLNDWGGGAKQMNGRLTFGNFNQDDFGVLLEEGDKITWRVKDDLTDVTHAFLMAEGYVF